MKQVEELVGALEKKYKIDIEKLLELYQAGIPRDEIAVALDVQEWNIRTVMNALNCRMAKKYRAHDYSYFLSRFGDTANVELVEEVQELKEDLDQLSKDLVSKENALKSARRAVDKYRRASEGNQDISDIVREVLSAQSVPTTVVVSAPEITGNYLQHTSIVMLSDLHFEELVARSDVGNSNEFNWDVAEARLNKVFNEVHVAYRGEGQCAVLLGGDMISGIIHDTLESTSKPTVKAVADLAVILANHIRRLASMYVHVYVAGVSGNHGRISENRKSTAQGFNFEYLMYTLIETYLADLSNVVVEISTTGLLVFLAGDENKPIGLHHGDMFRFSGDMKYLKVKEAFRQSTGYVPEVILQGHTHQFRVEEMPDNGKYITNGSLIGVNGYCHTNGFLGLAWSQTIMTLLPDGTVENVRAVCG